MKKKVLSILLAAAMTVTAAGMIPSNSMALEGSAEYEPAESNLSGKYWVTAAADTGNAENAMDQDEDTAWVAEEFPAVFNVDLGGSYDAIHKIVNVFANGTNAWKYTIEGSKDGEEWTVLADRSKNEGKGGVFTDIFSMEGLRYLRLNVISGNAGGLKEFQIINYLRPDMNNGSDTSEQGGNTNAYYYNAGNNPVVEGIRGGKFTDEGSIENGNNFFGLTKDLGWATIRLRIWNEPKSETSGKPNESAGNCSPENTYRVARAIKGAGQNLAIDFHYSDSWSDPQNQPKPYAWAGLSFDELVQATYDYTYETIGTLIEQGTAPSIVAIGNEITNGMMWGQEYDEITPYVHHHDYYNQGLHELAPGGGIKWMKYEEANGDKTSEAYQEFLGSIDNLSCLVDAGNRAVQKLNEENGLDIQTEMHFAFNVFEQPTGQDKVQLDLDVVLEKVKTLISGLAERLEAKGGMVDRLGISYYPDWHGTYDTVQRNIVELSKMLPGVQFNIAECSPKASGTVTDWMADPNHEVGFKYSIQSQGDDAMNIMKTINDVPNNVGMGVWPWAGTNVFGSGRGDNATLNASFKVWNDAFAKNILESDISVVAEEGETADLPDTVKSLDLATGEVKDVQVDWDEEDIETGKMDEDGNYTVDGVADVTVPSEGRGKAMTKVTAVVEKEAEEISTDVLEYALTLADRVNTDGVVASVVERYNAALANAQDILAKVHSGDASVTQDMVDNAWQELVTVMQYLSFKQGDKTDLDKVIALADTMNADLSVYLDEGKDAFTDALDAAKAVQADGDAMQEDVNNAWQNLLTAMAGLQRVPDKTALEELLSKAAILNENDYEAASFAVFRTVFAEAKAVYEDDQANAEEVKTATQNLEGAIAKLTPAAETEKEIVANAQTSTAASTTDNSAEKTNTADNVQKTVEKSAKTGDSTNASAMAAAGILAAVAAAFVWKKKDETSK